MTAKEIFTAEATLDAFIDFLIEALGETGLDYTYLYGEHPIKLDLCEEARSFTFYCTAEDPVMSDSAIDRCLQMGFISWTLRSVQSGRKRTYENGRLKVWHF